MFVVDVRRYRDGPPVVVELFELLLNAAETYFLDEERDVFQSEHIHLEVVRDLNAEVVDMPQKRLQRLLAAESCRQIRGCAEKVSELHRHIFT